MRLPIFEKCPGCGCDVLHTSIAVLGNRGVPEDVPVVMERSPAFLQCGSAFPVPHAHAITALTLHVCPTPADATAPSIPVAVSP